MSNSLYRSAHFEAGLKPGTLAGWLMQEGERVFDFTWCFKLDNPAHVLELVNIWIEKGDRVTVAAKIHFLELNKQYERKRE